MTATAVRAVRSPTRCPFCHDEVDVRSEWVACRACLARHHQACWGEARVCATCQETACLSTHPEPLASPVESSSHSVFERLRDPPFSKSVGPAFDYVGSLLTLGFHPAVTAELRLLHHLEQNALKNCDASVKSTRRRLRTAVVVFGLAVAGALLGGALSASGSMWPQIIGSHLILLALVAWIPTVVGLLVTHYRAVRRHDADQIRSRAELLTHDQAERMVAEHEIAWSATGGRLALATVIATFFSSLCFPLAWLIAPFWLARAFKIPFELHERREQLGAFESR